MLGLDGVLPLLDHSLCDVHVQRGRVSKIPEKNAIHSYWNHMKTGQPEVQDNEKLPIIVEEQLRWTTIKR
jgi:hypothetical protein